MGLEALAISVGSFVSFGMATGVTALVIGSAVIGAAIGGLTAAVTDGDIGKGMLFGAIGGAVTGGIASYASGGVASEAISGSMQTSMTGVGGTSFTEVAGASAGGIWDAGGMTLASSVTEGIGSGSLVTSLGSAGALESIGMQVGLGALTTGVKSYLAAGIAEDQNEAAMKAKDEEMATYLEMQKMKGDQAMEQLRYQRENASEADKLALAARTAELDQRKIEFNEQMALQREQFDFQTEAKAKRQSLFGEEARRGTGASDTLATTGIYDYLQTKPVSALKQPKEEVA